MMNRRIMAIFAISILLLSSLPEYVGGSHAAVVSRATGALTKAKRAAMPGRVIVKFREDATADDVEQFIGAHSNRPARRLSVPRLHVMNISPEIDASDYANYLSQLPGVEFAEPDYIAHPADMTPNDPLCISEWHLYMIHAPAAWSMTTGSDQVVIAICDTGIDPTQPDLAAKLVPGWNVVDDNADTSPVHPHGTWVAGTAAAASNNGVGVAAPAMNCRLMPLRISTASNGDASMSDIVEAITWAADHGARVINLSYSGFGSSALADAARYAHSQNSVFVMAAGNDAAYVPVNEDPNVISVSGTTSSDTLASFTTTGPFVDLAAPGNEILTTGTQGTYLSVSGTSFSAPLVAGAAALLLSVNPALTPAQVEAFLKVSADDLGSAGYDTGYGFGRLNMGRAVELAAAALHGGPDVTAPASRFLSPLPDGLVGQTRAERVQVEAADDRTVAKVTLYADGVKVGTKTAAPFVFSWDTSTLADGSTHTLQAAATDAAGNTSTLQMVATVLAGYDITPPQVTITSPQDGDHIGGNVRVTVKASDNSGEIIRVELYVDGVLMDQSNHAPFTFRWAAHNSGRGLHTLICLAYDESFNIGTSNTVRVTR
jgi:thermitase